MRSREEMSVECFECDNCIRVVGDQVDYSLCEFHNTKFLVELVKDVMKMREILIGRFVDRN